MNEILGGGKRIVLKLKKLYNSPRSLGHTVFTFLTMAGLVTCLILSKTAGISVKPGGDEKQRDPPRKNV